MAYRTKSARLLTLSLRHGESGPNGRLTSEGRAHVRRVAAELAERLDAPKAIIHSPSLRAEQMAQILGLTLSPLHCCSCEFLGEFTYWEDIPEIQATVDDQFREAMSGL